MRKYTATVQRPSGYGAHREVQLNDKTAPGMEIWIEGHRWIVSVCQENSWAGGQYS